MKAEKWEKIARFYVGRYLQYKHNHDLMPKDDVGEDLMPTCHPSMIDAELLKNRALTETEADNER